MFHTTGNQGRKPDIARGARNAVKCALLILVVVVMGMAVAGCTQELVAGLGDSLNPEDSTNPLDGAADAHPMPQYHYSSPIPNLTAYFSGPSSAAYGSTFTVQLVITNNGGATAYYVNVTLSPYGGISTNTTRLSLWSSNPGSSQTLSITATAPSYTSYSGAGISARITYSDNHKGSGTVFTSLANYSVAVTGSAGGTPVTVTLASPLGRVFEGGITVYDSIGNAVATKQSSGRGETSPVVFTLSLPPGTYSIAGIGRVEASRGWVNVGGRRDNINIGAKAIQVAVWVCLAEAPWLCLYFNSR